jgi:hypothetical protein
MKVKTIIPILLLIIVRLGFSQDFANLDFESAVINTSGAPQFHVVANDAIPNWTAYLGVNAQTYILYNAVNLDAAGVSIQGTNTPTPSLVPIQGNYSIFLQGASLNVPGATAAIGQTGQIPTDALSLIFWGSVGLGSVSFNGQSLSLSVLGSTANYNIYGADISAFTGQTGQLLFTAQPQGYIFFDNVQFSSSAVPEPSPLALSALGALLLGFRRWRN